MFVRIVGNGYDRNGNYTYKVYAYAQSNADQRILDYMGIEALKKCVNGRVNREKHYILTQATKNEIMQGFDAEGYDPLYIFE